VAQERQGGAAHVLADASIQALSAPPLASLGRRPMFQGRCVWSPALLSTAHSPVRPA
jgi:hypothetical protein